jgi:hypothetical protein
MKCIRTSCCKELTACDQAPSCADCRDCYLGGSSGCTSACSTTEGMALHDCKSNLCSNATSSRVRASPFAPSRTA